MVAIPALMLANFLGQVVSNSTVKKVFYILGWTILGVATALTIISMINYLVKNRKFFVEEKEEVSQDK